jgi:hypothetical protein
MAKRKPKVVEVPVSKIKFNPDLYPRVGTDPLTVTSYKDAMDAGSKFPAIIVDRKTHEIIDGAHRWQAIQLLWRIQCRRAKRNGKRKPPEPKIMVEYRTYKSDAERFLEAIEFNIENPKPLSPFDKGLCLVKTRLLGILDPVAQWALRLNDRKFQDIVKHKLAERDGQPVVIKNTLSRWIPKALTGGSKEVPRHTLLSNRRADGHGQLFIIHQLINLFVHGSVYKDDEIRKALTDLQGYITKYLGRGGRGGAGGRKKARR